MQCLYKDVIMYGMKTLKFKLYDHKRNRYLKRTINVAGAIYNHCIALHKRYYRMWGKHLNCAKLQAHIAKLRNRNPLWQQVGSQAVQDICQRIERAYQAFFERNKQGVKPPGFKKVRKYKSFTLKQAGYKFLGGNRVKIGNRVFQFGSRMNCITRIASSVALNCSTLPYALNSRTNMTFFATVAIAATENYFIQRSQIS